MPNIHCRPARPMYIAFVTHHRSASLNNFFSHFAPRARRIKARDRTGRAAKWMMQVELPACALHRVQTKNMKIPLVVLDGEIVAKFVTSARFNVQKISRNLKKNSLAFFKRLLENCNQILALILFIKALNENQS